MSEVLAHVLLPALATIAIWWGSTALILRLDRLPPATFKWTFGAFSALMLGAFWVLYATRDATGVAAAWMAFSAGILVWAWHEVAFLFGYVTGPRVAALPPRSGPWLHLTYATETVLYHECALLVSGVAVAALTAGAANRTGLWTFAILWVMRLSAKLNLVLGVRNAGAELLPPHLSYLGSYFVRRRMNLLFPVSVGAATLVAALLWRSLPAASPFESASLAFLASLLSLAILEHLFMVLPFDTQAFWQPKPDATLAKLPPSTA